MRKTLKTTCFIFAGLVVLVLVAIGLAALLIDPNDFKPEITSAVKNKIGRDLTIEGELKLSVFPWLGVSTGNISLSNAQGFQDKPFATIGQSQVSIKLLSLLTKQLEVSQVVVDDLNLNLAINPQGIKNWADLGEPQTAGSNTSASPIKQTSTNNATLAALAVGGISIKNAHIDWHDQQANQHFSLSAIHLNTGQFNVTQPVAVDLSFVALNNQTKTTESVKLTADLVANQDVNRFNLTKPTLQVTIAGEDIPNKQLPITLAARNIALDLSKQDIHIADLQINSGEVKLNSQLVISNIKEKPSLQGSVHVATFNLAKIIKQFGIALPNMQDGNALSRLTLTTNLQANADAVDLQNLNSKLDDSTITGTIHVKNFSQPAIMFNLAIDNIDADRYLSGDAKPAAKAIASPAVALAGAASLLPVESLRKINADGELILNTLKVNDLKMQGIRLHCSARDGLVKTKQSAQQFYQGAYSGNVDLDVNNTQPAMAINEKINHAQIEPILKAIQSDMQMTGLIDAETWLKASGNKPAELRHSLTGQLSFSIKDSVIKGFNLQKIIDNGKAALNGSEAPGDSKNDQTLFSALTGSATITNGLIQNNDLVGTAAKLRIDGKGSADLNTEKIDYKIDTKFPDASKPVPGVVINIAGTFDRPSYQIDVSALLKDKNTGKVLDNILEHNKDKIDKLMDKLDKKIGPGANEFFKKLF